MLYQTLVGAWLPGAIDNDFTQRIEDYAIKAAREGKLETSWLNPDEEYENGLRGFIRADAGSRSRRRRFSNRSRISRAAWRCSAR